jgi:hypothetical protein
VRDPLTGCRSRTTDSRRAHRSVRAAIIAWCRCRTSRREQLLPHRRPDRQLGSPADARSTASRRNDSIFGRYIYSNRTAQIPGAFGGVLDGTGTSAFGNQTIKTNALVGGWTRVISSAMVNEFRFSWSQSRPTRCSSRSAQPPPRRDDSRIGDQPARAGGLPASRSTATSADRASAASARPTSCRSSSTPTSSSSSTRVSWLRGNHCAQGRRRHHRADAERVHGRAGDARRAALPHVFTGNAMADYLLGYVADLQLSNVFVVEQRHRAQMSSSRTTGR